MELCLVTVSQHEFIVYTCVFEFVSGNFADHVNELRLKTIFRL